MLYENSSPLEKKEGILNTSKYSQVESEQSLMGTREEFVHLYVTH